MKKSQAELRELLALAGRAATAGASVLAKAGLPQAGVASQLKGRGDYVTASDTASEEAIVGVLVRESPEIPVLAEERGGAGSGDRWVVDPLDGTTNFMRGMPVVGVSVGLLGNGEPLVGVVLAPFLRLRFAAAAGCGLTHNGQRVVPKPGRPPAQAIVATGFPFRDRSRLPRYEPVLAGALRAFEDLRRAGAASLDLSWTAVGAFDGFFEMGLGLWDLCAGAALVRESGGLVTDWEGGESWRQTGNVMAGAPPVHGELLRLAAASGAGPGSSPGIPS